MAGMTISIHASRGGSDDKTDKPHLIGDISIHASRGGSDSEQPKQKMRRPFISIHASRGGSDPPRPPCLRPLPISIHASRGGSDKFFEKFIFQSCYFNPRFPRGKRPRLPWFIGLPAPFQSTLPAGEATIQQPGETAKQFISIHASRGGSDLHGCWPFSRVRHFNPRFPRGKRR